MAVAIRAHFDVVNWSYGARYHEGGITMGTIKNLGCTILCVTVMCVMGAAKPLFAEELTRPEDFICEVVEDMSGVRIKGIRTSHKSVTKIVIPSAVEDVAVTEIAHRAFYECNALVSVSIPNTVIRIDGFGGCASLGSIVLPESLKYIGDEAFSGCKSLKSIEIPDSVTSIGKGAFMECSRLVSITFSKSLKEIAGTSRYDGMFYRCTALKSIVIPDAVTKIGWSAFDGCTALESVTLPISLKEIGVWAFRNCSSLKTVTIPDGVTKVEFSDSPPFRGCSSMSMKSQMVLRKLGYEGDF